MVKKKQIPSPSKEIKSEDQGSKGWVKKVVDHYEDLTEQAMKDTLKSEKHEIIQNEIFHATHHNVFAKAEKTTGIIPPMNSIANTGALNMLIPSIPVKVT